MESYLKNEEYVIKTLIDVCGIPKDVVKYVICKYLENKVYRTEDTYLQTIEWENDKRKLHRDNDRPAVECFDGTKEWWKNGELHRDVDISTGEAKPAIIYSDGPKAWYKNGKLHREDDSSTGENQPAVLWTSGCKDYWKNGIQYFPNNF